MFPLFTFQVQDRPKKENCSGENTRRQEGRLGVKLYCHHHIANYLYRIYILQYAIPILLIICIEFTFIYKFCIHIKTMFIPAGNHQWPKSITFLWTCWPRWFMTKEGASAQSWILIYRALREAVWYLSFWNTSLSLKAALRFDVPNRDHNPEAQQVPRF